MPHLLFKIDIRRRVLKFKINNICGCIVLPRAGVLLCAVAARVHVHVHARAVHVYMHAAAVLLHMHGMIVHMRLSTLYMHMCTCGDQALLVLRMPMIYFIQLKLYEFLIDCVMWQQQSPWMDGQAYGTGQQF